jgi:DnaJ-class molecular chaperone
LGLLEFLFGTSIKVRAQRDQYWSSVIGKNLISPINDHGTCFTCDGTGQRTLACRACGGSGMHEGNCQHCQASGQIEKPHRLASRAMGAA